MVAAFLASAALIVAGSLIVGQAALTLCGRPRPTPLAAPVGLALLLSASGIAAGLGARGTAIAITFILLTLFAAIAVAATRPGPWSERAGARRRGLRSTDARKMRGRDAEFSPAPGARPIARPTHAWVPPLIAAVLAAAFASLPFVAAGRIGILGVGLVNDDMAYHLLMADWIAERFSPEPELIADGYPLGPHALVTGLSTLLGGRSIDVFAGLVVAIPALSALTAFAILAELRTARRVAVSALVAVPYLIAAYLAQEAFKEPIIALLLLGFAVLLAERPPPDGVEPRWRRGRGIVLGVIAAGAIYVYSFPSIAWLAAGLALWAVLEAWRRSRGSRESPLALARAVAPAAAAGLLAWLAITLPDLGRVVDFADFRALDPDRANEGGLGNLRGHLSPLEAFGIWPTSEFRLAAGAGALPAAAFYAGALLAAAGLAAGLPRWLRAHGPAIPLALVGAVVIYAGARGLGTVYTSAKALAIVAPLITIVALGGLLGGNEPGRSQVVRALLAVAIAAGMALSSFLVLRQAPVGPEDHLDQLAAIRPHVAGEELLFLGRDNFVLYGLRGSRPHTHVRNFYNPYSVPGNPAIDDVERKFDFDSVDAETLARFPYVLTTRAGHASGPPPGYEATFETDGYVLWRRDGDDAGRLPVESGLQPGAELDCARDRVPSEAAAVASWERPPVLAGDVDWRPSATVESSSPASVELDLPPGDWELSLQYDATARLTLRAPGLEAELPGNLDYRGATPFWPAGRVDDHPGGRLAIEASVAAPPLAGRILGAETAAHLGTIAATPAAAGYGAAASSATPPFPGSAAGLAAARDACGRYADWLGDD